jgi:hypothetical protein
LRIVFLELTPGCLTHIVRPNIQAGVVVYLVAFKTNNPLGMVEVEIKFLGLGCLVAKALLGQNLVPKFGLHDNALGSFNAKVTIFDVFFRGKHNLDLFQHVRSLITGETAV